MIGFEPGIFGVGSNRSTECATTTATFSIFLYLSLLFCFVISIVSHILSLSLSIYLFHSFSVTLRLYISFSITFSHMICLTFSLSLSIFLSFTCSFSTFLSVSICLSLHRVLRRILSTFVCFFPRDNHYETFVTKLSKILVDLIEQNI